MGASVLINGTWHKALAELRELELARRFILSAHRKGSRQSLKAGETAFTNRLEAAECVML